MRVQFNELPTYPLHADVVSRLGEQSRLHPKAHWQTSNIIKLQLTFNPGDEHSTWGAQNEGRRGWELLFFMLCHAVLSS